MNTVVIQFDDEDSNDIPLKLSASGKISLSDITAATIGNLGESWSDGNSCDSTSVLRPWEDKLSSGEEERNQTYIIDGATKNVSETMGTSHHHSNSDAENCVDVKARNQTNKTCGERHGGEETGTSYPYGNQNAGKLVEAVRRHQNFSPFTSFAYRTSSSIPELTHANTDSLQHTTCPSYPFTTVQPGSTKRTYDNKMKEQYFSENVHKQDIISDSMVTSSQQNYEHSDSETMGYTRNTKTALQSTQPSNSSLNKQADQSFNKENIYHRNMSVPRRESAPAPVSSSSSLYSTLIQLSGTRGPNEVSTTADNRYHSNNGHMTDFKGVLSTLQEASTPVKNQPKQDELCSNSIRSGSKYNVAGTSVNSLQNVVPGRYFGYQDNSSMAMDRTHSTQRGTSEIYEIARKVDSMYPPATHKASESCLPTYDSHDYFIKRQKLTPTYDPVKPHTARDTERPFKSVSTSNTVPDGCNSPMFMNFLDDISKRMVSANRSPLHINDSSLPSYVQKCDSKSVYSPTTKETGNNSLELHHSHMATLSKRPMHDKVAGIHSFQQSHDNTSIYSTSVSEQLPSMQKYNIAHCPTTTSELVLDAGHVSHYPQPSYSRSPALSATFSQSNVQVPTSQREPSAMSNIMKSVENFNNSLIRLQTASPVAKTPIVEPNLSTPNTKELMQKEIRYSKHSPVPSQTNVQSNITHQSTTPLQSNRYLSTVGASLGSALESPGVETRYTDSLFSHLGSPHTNTTDNKFLWDLKTLLSTECKKEIVPQTLFKMHMSHDYPETKVDVFTRERNLQERFEALRPSHPEEISKLSSFFRYQSALIETDRFRMLHECQYPQSYKQSVGDHFNQQLHKLMDRVERSVQLIEQADRETRRFKPSKSRPHLSRSSVERMERWYAENMDHPYPTSMVIEQFAELGNISVEQVKKWFANKRNRSQNTRTLTEIAMKKRKLGQLMS